MPLVLPIVSILTTGILVIMQMALMLNVVLARLHTRQSLGDGGHQKLQQAIRRHGNFAENAALFVIGIALLELAGGSRSGIVMLCTLFVIGRVSHVIGLSMQRTSNAPRTVGIVLTAFVGVALGIRLILFAVAHWPGA